MATGFRFGAKALVTVNAIDLSAYCDDAGLDIGIETAETTTFSATWKTFIEGLAGAKFSLKGPDDFACRFGRRMPAREIRHLARNNFNQVAPVGHLVRSKANSQRGSLNRGPAGVISRGVIAKNRHVSYVAARRHACRDHCGAANLASSG